jgi:hypothetical protein
VTDLLQIVSRLKESGGTLALNGDRIRYSVPSGDTEAVALLAELRKHRDALRKLLRRRGSEDRTCPPGSFEATRRFGQPHAKLLPFLGHKVRTPEGPGTLLQVFADRVTVLLDRDLKKCSFFSPSEIEPVSGDWLK